MKNICVGHETTESGIECMTLHLITLFMGKHTFCLVCIIKDFLVKSNSLYSVDGKQQTTFVIY